MSKADIERQVRHHERALRRLLEQQESLEGRPEEPEVGSVVSWAMRFRPGAQEYSYAALRTPIGWYLTGRQGAKALSWDAVLDLVDEGELTGDLRLWTSWSAL